MSPRTQEQFEKMRADRKAEILEAALNVFAEEGYHSASIAKVSKRAGVSKGLLYNYFESKQELLQVLLHEIMDKQFEYVQNLVEDGVSDESITKLIHHTVQLLKEDPKHWKLYFLMAIQPDVFEIIIEDRKEQMTTYMQKYVEYFSSRYPENAEAMMHYFSASFSGIRMNYIMNPDTFPIDQVTELLIQQFVKQ
jgi:AcrR family transcriptional regulator